MFAQETSLVEAKGRRAARETKALGIRSPSPSCHTDGHVHSARIRGRSRRWLWRALAFMRANARCEGVQRSFICDEA